MVSFPPFPKDSTSESSSLTTEAARESTSPVSAISIGQPNVNETPPTSAILRGRVSAGKEETFPAPIAIPRLPITLERTSAENSPASSPSPLSYISPKYGTHSPKGVPRRRTNHDAGEFIFDHTQAQRKSNDRKSSDPKPGPFTL